MTHLVRNPLTTYTKPQRVASEKDHGRIPIHVPDRTLNVVAMASPNTSNTASPSDSEHGEIVIDRMENAAARKLRAQRRAEKKSETLRAFFASQPRDGWAAQTEIELRQLQLPPGILFEEVSCHSTVCRIVATGQDKMQVLEAVSSSVSTAGMKSYTRWISDPDGTAKAEGFMSPSGTQWPQPSYDDG
jgi:hypothetical protein